MSTPITVGYQPFRKESQYFVVGGSGPDYDTWLRRIQERYDRLSDKPMFLADVGDLFQLYLRSFPKARRQHHNCHTCRRFFEQYGGLAVVQDGGRLQSVLWNEDDAPAEYKRAACKLRLAVENTLGIKDVFLVERAECGQRFLRDGWTHFHFVAGTGHRAAKAEQKKAERREDVKNVDRALQDYPHVLLQKALETLEYGSVYRKENLVSPIRFLLQLQQELNAMWVRCQRNLLWRAVANAPPGFTHIRSGIVGAFLEDVRSGGAHSAVRKVQERLDPLQYRRPQAAPAAGTIQQAERLVQELGIERSFERRYARIGDLHCLPCSWVPPKQAPATGMFSHLLSSGNAGYALPAAKRITMARFKRDFLPGAARVQVSAPYLGSYAAWLTATHDDAPPILKWDRVGRRCPLSWYMYYRGTRASHWGLHGGHFVDVVTIVQSPDAHGAKFEFFVLEGARDSNHVTLGLFPEILRSDLNSIRAVAEAYSKTRYATGFAEQSAAGIVFDEHFKGELTVRVVSRTGVVGTFIIDRWE